MQAALASGRVTSRDLVAAYLGRIAQYEPTLNATMSVNLNAYSEADDLDRERQQGKVRGPLHAPYRRDHQHAAAALPRRRDIRR